MFHGPPNCGKSFVASKLAVSLHAIHADEGFEAEITKVVLDATSSKDNLVEVLIAKNGLVMEKRQDDPDLEKK